MFAHELEAEAVQRADVREIETGELLGPEAGVAFRFGFDRSPQTGAHLGGGGFGEGDDEQFINPRTIVFQAMKAAIHEGLGLARASASHDEDIAARLHSQPLRFGGRVGVRGWVAHLIKNLATDGHR